VQTAPATQFDEVMAQGALGDPARLRLSGRAHVITPWHTALDKAREEDRDAQGRPVEEVGDADAAARNLVLVGRADAAPGGADGRLLARLFPSLVEGRVPRRDDVGPARESQPRRVAEGALGHHLVDAGPRPPRGRSG
jgi:hypothetical protein